MTSTDLPRTDAIAELFDMLRLPLPPLPIEPLTVAAFAPAPVPIDVRPARGKHRTRRSTAAAVLAWSRRQRGAFLLAGMSAGALVAALTPAVAR